MTKTVHAEAINTASLHQSVVVRARGGAVIFVHAKLLDDHLAGDIVNMHAGLILLLAQKCGMIQTIMQADWQQ